MANDKTKIIAEAVDVYIAGTQASLEPGSWLLVGWCEGGSIKLSPQNRNSIELHNGSQFRLSTSYLFEALSLESDNAKVQLIEFVESAAGHSDVLLITRSDRTKGRRLTNVNLMLEADFIFSDTVPRKLKLEATRTAQHFSDFYEELTGLSGF